MRANARANRERILVAADAVFGEQGPAGSTEEVAARAGVGIGTVFRHFPTKSELIEAALLRHFQVLADDVTARLDSDDPGNALADVVRTMISAGSTKLTLASLLPDGGFTPAVRDESDRVRALVASLLDAARRTGSVRSDVAIDEIYLLVRALAQTTAVSPTEPTTLNAAVDLVLHGLRPGD